MTDQSVATTNSTRRTKKKFHKWMKEKWTWIFAPLPPYPFKEYVMPIDQHNAIDGEKERRRYLSEAYYIAMNAKSFKEIKARKDEDRNWYWASINLEDFLANNKGESI